MKQLWEMTREEWTESLGAPEPTQGFPEDMSLHQAAFMSDRAKSGIRKERSQKRKIARDKFEIASAAWENGIRDGFINGQLRLKEVFAKEDFEADAYGVIAEVLETCGILLDSPFRARRRSDRVEYLKSMEREFWAKWSAAGKPVPAEVLADCSAVWFDPACKHNAVDGTA